NETIDIAMQDNMWATAPSPPGPMTNGAEGRKKLQEHAKAFRASTDRAIVALFGGNLLEMGQMMYRADTFFLLLAENPQKAHAFLDRLVEFHLKNLTTFLEDVAPYVDIILFGDDLGMQSGPQISPRMYREFFKPRHQLLWSQVKKEGLSVMLHCCGGVRPLLADLIDAGLDAINPVQVSCKGMDLRELKKDFGSEMCFWGGGCDTQRILPKAQPQEIREHVLKAIEIMQPGGGFVFQQVHNILADSPPEHIAAMVDAIHDANANQ
ncbi:methyltransferase, partial [bacterium]|nr:methyltransferase [bacterium]